MTKNSENSGQFLEGYHEKVQDKQHTETWSAMLLGSLRGGEILYEK